MMNHTCGVGVAFSWVVASAVILPKQALAQQKTNGVIVVEEASIFYEPTFESEVVGTIHGGQKVLISKQKKGAFYKILLKPGQMGWISDGEVKLLQKGNESKKNLTGASQEKASSKKPNRLPPLESRGLLGLIHDGVQFQEDTMGKIRSSYLPMWGMRWSGPNTLMSGDIPMDSQVLFFSGAPSHYADATGSSTSGFMLLASTVFVTDVPLSRDLMAYYGFGPMVRLNQFHVELRNDPTPGISSRYDLQDIVLGAVFQGGVAVGLSTWVLRLDGYYHWELRRYSAFAMSIQRSF